MLPVEVCARSPEERVLRPGARSSVIFLFAVIRGSGGKVSFEAVYGRMKLNYSYARISSNAVVLVYDTTACSDTFSCIACGRPRGHQTDGAVLICFCKAGEAHPVRRAEHGSLPTGDIFSIDDCFSCQVPRHKATKRVSCAIRLRGRSATIEPNLSRPMAYRAAVKYHYSILETQPLPTSGSSNLPSIRPFSSPPANPN